MHKTKRMLFAALAVAAVLLACFLASCTDSSGKEATDAEKISEILTALSKDDTVYTVDEEWKDGELIKAKYLVKGNEFHATASYEGETEYAGLIFLDNADFSRGYYKYGYVQDPSNADAPIRLKGNAYHKYVSSAFPSFKLWKGLNQLFPSNFEQNDNGEFYLTESGYDAFYRAFVDPDATECDGETKMVYERLRLKYENESLIYSLDLRPDSESYQIYTVTNVGTTDFKPFHSLPWGGYTVPPTADDVPRESVIDIDPELFRVSLKIDDFEGEAVVKGNEIHMWGKDLNRPNQPTQYVGIKEENGIFYYYDLVGGGNKCYQNIEQFGYTVTQIKQNYFPFATFIESLVNDFESSFVKNEELSSHSMALYQLIESKQLDFYRSFTGFECDELLPEEKLAMNNLVVMFHELAEYHTIIANFGPLDGMNFSFAYRPLNAENFAPYVELPPIEGNIDDGDFVDDIDKSAVATIKGLYGENANYTAKIVGFSTSAKECYSRVSGWQHHDWMIDFNNSVNYFGFFHENGINYDYSSQEDGSIVKTETTATQDEYSAAHVILSWIAPNFETFFVSEDGINFQISEDCYLEFYRSMFDEPNAVLDAESEKMVRSFRVIVLEGQVYIEFYSYGENTCTVTINEIGTTVFEPYTDQLK